MEKCTCSSLYNGDIVHLTEDRKCVSCGADYSFRFQAPVPTKSLSKEELDTLWLFFREFVENCNQSNMTDSATEFLSWLQSRKMVV